MKSLVSHVLNLKSRIKLIDNTEDVCNFVKNEFNPPIEVQNMGNETFKNASFGNASFPNRALKLQLSLRYEGLRRGSTFTLCHALTPFLFHKLV